MKRIILGIVSVLVTAGMILTVVFVRGNYHAVDKNKIESVDVLLDNVVTDTEEQDWSYSYIELEGLSPSDRLGEVDKWAWHAQGGAVSPVFAGDYWEIELVYHMKDGKRYVRTYRGTEDSPAGQKYFVTLALKAQELYMAEKDKRVDYRDEYYDDPYDDSSEYCTDPDWEYRGA